MLVWFTTESIAELNVTTRLSDIDLWWYIKISLNYWNLFIYFEISGNTIFSSQFFNLINYLHLKMLVISWIILDCITITCNIKKFYWQNDKFIFILKMSSKSFKPNITFFSLRKHLQSCVWKSYRLLFNLEYIIFNSF